MIQLYFDPMLNSLRVKDFYVAGENVVITGNTISAFSGSGGSVIAGQGISVQGATIGVKNDNLFQYDEID